MASKKPTGLGRGLGALLGEEALKAESSGTLYLPISQVESCSSQPRKHFDEAALAELADELVVRVAGYSAYFTRLPESIQDEVIERTSQDL